MSALKVIRRQLKDESGATALEFAIVSLPLLLLILGSLEYGIMFFAGQTLDNFTSQNARQLLTGSIQKQNLSSTAYRSAVCANLPSLFNCSSLYIDVNTVSAYASANTSSPTIATDKNGNITTGWNYNPGGPGDVIVVRFVYLWPVIGLPYGVTLGPTSNGKVQLLSTVVLKNEPYQ